MSIVLYDVSKSSNAATFTTTELNQAGFRVFVVYDTSTGVLEASQVPENLGCTHGYYRWRTSTGSDYSIVINNNLFYPKQQNTTLDYGVLGDHNFNLVTYDEFYIVQMLKNRLDMVARRGYLEEKKFSYKELLSFLHQATIEVDMHPPATSFWYMWSQTADEGDSTNAQPQNPFLMRSHNQKVPFAWHSLLVEGAVLIALIEQGILEIDVNMNYSDQGITIQYNNIQPLQSMYQMMIDRWNEKKHLLKMNYFRPQGIGTLDFASGLIGAVTNMLGDVGSAGFPWWARGTGIRV